MARVPVPPAVRACFWMGVALTAAYAGICAATAARDPRLAGLMVRMYALTMAGGREAAALDALHEGMPVAVAWGMSVLDDVGTLLLALALAWAAYELLLGVAWVRRLAMRLETAALRRRPVLRRWGLAGLAAFYFLPGLGSGVAAVCLLGVIARVPVARLAVTFSAAAVVVDGVWVGVLSFPARALPDAGPWDWLPPGVAALAALLLALGWVRERRSPTALLPFPFSPAPAQRPRLEAWGFRGRDGLAEVDLPTATAALPDLGAKAVFAVELLLLDGMTPEAAAALVRAGVRGVRHLAVWGPGRGVPGIEAGRLDAWRGAAAALAAASVA